MSENIKQRVLLLLPISVCLFCTLVISFFWLQQYNQDTYEDISGFCQMIVKNNPEAEEMLLISLKEYTSDSVLRSKNDNFLAQYGYQPGDFGKNDTSRIIIIMCVAFMLMSGGMVLYSYVTSVWRKKRIEELTNYLELINIGSLGTVIQKKEDEFAHLEDEIYKTVTTLRQTRDAAVNTKINYADNLANIAHQLKTKLTTISLSLQLFMQDKEIEHIGVMEKQLEGLNRLEESLLTISKLDAGVLELEKDSVDIYTALSLATDNLMDLLREKEISVDIPEKECVEIQGDMEWTMEAFMNIIKNCMEHSVNGSVIHCDYSYNPLYTEILIWDEGKGFEKEDIPHLFERFYRGKSASENGVGIGLNLAKTIFEMQNGNVTARNLANGGACFEIRVYSH